MVFRIFLPSLLAFLILFNATIEIAEAVLKPEEIVVVVNAGSDDSLNLGRLYIDLRKIPVNHLVKVNVTTGEHISRDHYEERIAGPVRKK